MKADIVVWNCQGAGYPKFHKFLKEYLRDFYPNVVLLVETRVSGFKAKCVIKKIGLPNSHKVEASGFFGRVWILWKDIVNVIVEVNNFQFVHLKVKFSMALFTGIYRSPWWVLRKDLWVAFGYIAQNVKGPWTLAGDFNSLLNEDEKQGGSRKNNCTFPLFQQFCFDYSLKDIGFQGPKFTWNRGSLFECLDRARCNYQWDNLVPNSTVYHIHKIKFDHHPLAIRFGQYKTLKAPRPFRFLSSGLSHSDFGRFVNETWSNGEHLEGSVTSFVAAVKN
ncbi:hypothetical protein E1A91_D04G170700v1 [Gossypium mustelinum]|uniref:Endonuclease/exonuclease/phosphatase domain-containing protein n=1 Tax=Gossypium mustelinum TaxID=34275 RepID=A0A5D2VEZ3_GOSMU|nr:hypothetical protein E1A91_D04G170700v1 [Gossypium mustelinum]